VDTADRRGRRTDRREQVGRVMAELNAAVRDGRDRTHVFELICRSALTLTGAATATAMTIDPGGLLVVRAAAGRSPPWQRGAQITIDDTLAGSALRRREPVSAKLGGGGRPGWPGGIWARGDGGRLGDAFGEGGTQDGSPNGPGAREPGSGYHDERTLAAAGLRTVIYLPIPGYGSVTGVLGAGYRGGGTSTARRASLLEPLAAVAGLVPVDASPPDDLTGLAGTVAADRGRLAGRLEALVERVVTLTGAADCALYLSDGRLGLTPVAAAEAGHGRAGQAGDAGRPGGVRGGPADPVTVARLLADRRPSTLWHLPGGALLCVPLPASGSVLGALCARWPEGEQPGQAERMLINLTAGEAAYVVDSGRRRAGAEEQAAARERERLARELHDSVVQTLYSIGLGASTATELLHHDPAQAGRSMAWIQETAAAGLSDLRSLLLRLRPEALAGNELTTALGRLLETLQTLHGCRVSAQLGPEPAASSEVRQALYRIAQEAIQNAAQHARPGQVTLRLLTEGGDVILEIIDDGRGFTPGGDLPGRFGIRSMRERAMGAGGHLEVDSAPGFGTVVRAVLPHGD
jgi:signal transduction histidine kinase